MLLIGAACWAARVGVSGTTRGPGPTAINSGVAIPMLSWDLVASTENRTVNTNEMSTKPFDIYPFLVISDDHYELWCCYACIMLKWWFTMKTTRRN